MRLTQQAAALIRKMRGDLTQLQAATKLRINPQTWSRWERGENLPSLASLDRYAREFGFNLEIRMDCT